MSTELKRAKTMRPLRRVRLLNASLCVLMACMAIFAIVTGSAVALAIDLLSVFINAVAVAIQTYVIRKADGGRSRIGQPRFSELPGFLFILLAGAEYRRAAAGILERRTKRTAVVAAPLLSRSSLNPMCKGCGVQGPALTDDLCRNCSGQHPQRKTMRTVRADRIEELRRAGCTTSEMAAQLGLTSQTIRRYMIEAHADRDAR